MSNDSHIAQLEIAVALGRHSPALSPYRIAIVVHDLGRFGRQLRRRYEAQCSYAWADTERYRRQTDRLEEKTQKRAEEVGVALDLQRDPGGWPLILRCGGAEFRLGG